MDYLQYRNKIRKDTVMDSYGKLIVKTVGADEAFPVPEATVRIKGTDEINRDVIYTIFTDEDGVTVEVPLPAPNISNSESPYSATPPFYNYEVTVTKDGYYSKALRGVSVFPGILSVLTVNMIPFIGFNDGGRYPRENLVIQSEE